VFPPSSDRWIGFPGQAAMLRVRHLEVRWLRQDRLSGYGRDEGFLRQAGLSRERNLRLGSAHSMSTWDLYEWGR
jgi:hypothetical protein